MKFIYATVKDASDYYESENENESENESNSIQPIFINEEEDLEELLEKLQKELQEMRKRKRDDEDDDYDGPNGFDRRCYDGKFDPAASGPEAAVDREAAAVDQEAVENVYLEKSGQSYRSHRSHR